MSRLPKAHINPLEIYYRETVEDFELKSHFHNSHEIICIVEGKVNIKINERTYEINKNSLVFISNLESHEIKVLEYPYKRYFILIKPDYLQCLINDPVLASILKHRPDCFNHVISLDSGSSPEIMKIIQSMNEEVLNRKDFWEETLGSQLHILLVMLYRNYRNLFPLSMQDNASRILEVQKYIEEHYLEQISLKETARKFYMDMYYLSHTFKKVTGYTFRDYLTLQRISKARDLLFYTSEDITRIGLNSGFHNVNHFIRIFKKFEGITPYQYRKKYR